MVDKRSENRGLYLKALDIGSQQEPYSYWAPQELVEGFSEADILDAIRYLEEKGLIEALHSIGDRGLSAARITAFGQDFLSNAAAYRTDRTLGALANATIHVNTTNITNSTVGNLASGGSGHTFSGTVTIINHPEADELRDAFQAFAEALDRDITLPAYIKEEVGEQVQTVQEELAKPSAEQNEEKIAHRWERVSDLIASAPPLLEIGAAIGKLLVITHGSHAG